MEHFKSNLFIPVCSIDLFNLSVAISFSLDYISYTLCNSFLLLSLLFIIISDDYAMPN